MRPASSAILSLICCCETRTPSTSGWSSTGCSAVVGIGSNGAVIASSEREPVIPPLTDQASGQRHGTLPVPADDEPVERVDVAGAELARRSAGRDGRAAEDSSAYGGRQLGEPVRRELGCRRPGPAVERVGVVAEQVG